MNDVESMYFENAIHSQRLGASKQLQHGSKYLIAYVIDTLNCAAIVNYLNYKYFELCSNCKLFAGTCG